jgi:hypothetical protein
LIDTSQKSDGTILDVEYEDSHTVMIHCLWWLMEVMGVSLPAFIRASHIMESLLLNYGESFNRSVTTDVQRRDLLRWLSMVVLFLAAKFEDIYVSV